MHRGRERERERESNKFPHRENHIYLKANQKDFVTKSGVESRGGSS
jgi:hypothetical protein